MRTYSAPLLGHRLLHAVALSQQHLEYIDYITNKVKQGLATHHHAISAIECDVRASGDAYRNNGLRGTNQLAASHVAVVTGTRADITSYDSLHYSSSRSYQERAF